ncbi:MAG TPA: lipid II flippase MurJ [Terracidiphilus sp.]|nr:lipid II flippase MurJ [Terracidiphilus sp.]
MREQVPARRSIHRQVLHAAGAVTLAGIFVKCAAMSKEVVVAAAFGRSDAMDAFLIAALIPGLLINLIGESMNQALVPTLVHVREQEGQAQAQRLLSNALLWSSGLLAAALLAMGLGAHAFFPLIGSHFSPEKLALAERLFYGMLPVVLFTGIASNCTAVLNTLDKFALPALAPVVTPCVTVVFVLLLHKALGIWCLAVAAVAGALLHCIWMAGLLQVHGYRVSLRWYGMNAATRTVAHQYGPVLLSSVVASGGLLVDQSMAAMLPSGSVAALVYANRFVSVVLTLLGGAVASATTPYFAALTGRENWPACREALRNWLRWTALASVPIACALIAGSGWLVRVTFQRGAFSAHDTSVVGPVLAMYAVQIPFFVCSRIPYRFLLAMRRTDLILYCGLLNLVLDIALNLVLMRRMGVAGIALSTSLWTISTFLFLWFWARRLLHTAEQGAS